MKPISLKQGVIGFLLAIVAILGGNQVVDNLGGVEYTEAKTVLNAVSATTASAGIDIEGAKKVTLGLNVANVYGTGYATSTFTVQVSVDGTNYISYSKLVDNLTNSNSQNLTRVANHVIDTNASDFLSLDLEHDTFKYLKVTDTITGTTTSVVSVKALVTY